jgi:hypothetical protein
MVTHYKANSIQSCSGRFAVKYVTDADAHHLRNALLRNYEITTDWGGTDYSGITLKWDYDKCTCDISVLGYVNNV